MTPILINILKEATLSMIGKISWDVVFERFYTRAVVHGLNKIKDMETNEVVDDTVEDIINELKGKKLKVIDELK